ncbi:guanine nucleotide-exchange factor Sec12p [Trichomonascus vanleenenianus]|uniref:GTPase-activating protein SED4 n=1 Tax=Trichomonascus vanleenenianus TaxID=2268995 RepID=UPI003ECA2EB0
MGSKTLGHLNLEYPLFAVRIASDSMQIAAAGGGGEGRNGVKNKVSIVLANEDPNDPDAEVGVWKEDEFEFPTGEDNPTSMALQDEKLYVGVNRGEESIKAGKNDHLRVLDFDFAQELKTHQIFINDVVPVGEYQKCTVASAHLLAISASGAPGHLFVLHGRTLKVKYHMETEQEINDLHFSPDGKRLVVVLNGEIIVLDATTGKQKTSIEADKASGLVFAKARFVDEDTLVTAANLKTRKGAFVQKYTVAEDNIKLVASKRVKRIKAVTAMDARGTYTALGSSDLSIAIVSTKSLSTLEVKPNVHEFAITAIEVSASETLVVSVSAAGTLNVLQMPKDGEFHRTRATVIWSTVSLLITILVAIIFQLFVKHQIIDSLSVGRLIEDISSRGLVFLSPEKTAPPSRVEDFEPEMPEPEDEPVGEPGPETVIDATITSAGTTTITNYEKHGAAEKLL